MRTTLTVVLTLLSYSSFYTNPSLASSLDNTGFHTSGHSAYPSSHHVVRKPSSPRAASTEPAPITGSQTLRDMEIIAQRRLTTIVNNVPGSASNISSWISSLGTDGKWPDSQVNYTTGCDARLANWPAQDHWHRIITMAAAWHGGLAGAEQYVKDPSIRQNISLAMDYWFEHDFLNPACLDSGGNSTCPCGTPGLWNKNWFSNIILIPTFVSETCLVLNDTLTPSQQSNCTHISLRAYNTFNPTAKLVGYLTGANALGVAQIGIDQALLFSNVSLIMDAYQRIHHVLVIEPAVAADGIRPDGGFSQHQGILYSGNYGKDFTNSVMDLDIAAGGTQFAAGAVAQNAFGTLLDGDLWMIYRNIRTQVLHWDFSVLGRFISFPVIDLQATSGIKFNVSEVQALGEEWKSHVLTSVANTLSENSTTANQGDIIGNRMFFDNDYMVNRGLGYITTLKMYSNRTLNTECTNSQNPTGFHLSDGVVYTYMNGDEYEDIAAAWDWNLIPGITVDYDATPLTCANTKLAGVDAFVGGASDGSIGAAVMQYTNPVTRNLSWKKTWLFLENDVQHVMISHISSNSSAPVYSVIDQKRLDGGVFVDAVGTHGGNFTDPSTLWHGNVGYVFQKSNGSFSLSVETGSRTGNWSGIGVSTQPPATVDLFAAWIHHENISTPMSYTVFPNTDFGSFIVKSKQTRIQDVANDESVSAIYDQTHHTVMAVFWNRAGGSVFFDFGGEYAPLNITAHNNSVIIYRLDSGNVTVSDPSQTLTQLVIDMSWGSGIKPTGWDCDDSKNLTFALPADGLAGSSVHQVLAD